MERFSHWLAWGAVALIVAFAGLNWLALTAPTALDLLVMQVQAPLGMVLLGMTSVFVVLFVIATLYSRVSGLLESRRMHKEVRNAQEMADRAEASRIEGLQRLIVTEFRMLNERMARIESTLADAGHDTPLVTLPWAS